MTFYCINELDKKILFGLKLIDRIIYINQQRVTYILKKPYCLDIVFY